MSDKTQCVCCKKLFTPAFRFAVVCSAYCGNVYILRLNDYIEDLQKSSSTRQDIANRTIADLQLELNRLTHKQAPPAFASIPYIRSIVDEGLPES